jgi:hypothetical protein
MMQVRVIPFGVLKDWLGLLRPWSSWAAGEPFPDGLAVMPEVSHDA